MSYRLIITVICFVYCFAYVLKPKHQRVPSFFAALSTMSGLFHKLHWTSTAHKPLKLLSAPAQGQAPLELFG